MQTILLTGGLGFIGSHCVIALLSQGYKVVVVDSGVTCDPQAAKYIVDVLDEQQRQNFVVHYVDLRNEQALDLVFGRHHIDGVMHFAALKGVGESVQIPLTYWDNNVVGLITLLKVMHKHQVKQIIFSSSATVYGDNACPGREDATLPGKLFCPYGHTKLTVERILEDVSATGQLQAISLRYFNPVGAHSCGKIGEPLSNLNNLFPYMSAVYVGRKSHLVLFGQDYPTADGTCERDYIHIEDLARGHVLAFQYLFAHPEVKFEAFNLGSGKPISVLQIINEFNRQTNNQIPYQVGPRRAGDIPTSFADPTKAQKLLNFYVTRDLTQMVSDTLRFINYMYADEIAQHRAKAQHDHAALSTNGSSAPENNKHECACASANQEPAASAAPAQGASAQISDEDKALSHRKFLKCAMFNDMNDM